MDKKKLLFFLNYIDEKTLEQNYKFFKGLTKKLMLMHYKQMQWVSRQATKILLYTVTSSIFLFIYSRTSFEVTVVILLVGVVHYSILRGT